MLALHSKQLKRVLIVIYCATAIGLIAVVLFAVPKQRLTIGAGSASGSFYAISKKYRQLLETKGYDVTIKEIGNTYEIAERVNDPQSDVDVGFVAQNLRGKNMKNIISLGDVEFQPIFVFSNRRVKEIHSFADLKGMRLVMPPEQSTTSQAVRNILSLYKVEQDNTAMAFLPLNEAVAKLKDGQFDAGLFMLDAANPLVAEMATSGNLRLNGVSDIDALTKKFSFLHRISLSAGIFNFHANIPPNDVPMLAAKVTLVAKRNLPAATVYALLEAMVETHREGDYVSASGEFPSYVESDVPVHELVPEFYRAGTPWIFTHLPVAVASVVDKYLVVFLELWFFIHVLRTISDLSDLRIFVFKTIFTFTLQRIRKSLDHGRPPTERQAWAIRRIAMWVEKEEESTSLKILIAHLNVVRPSMKSVRAD